MTKLPINATRRSAGTSFSVPFPVETDPEALAILKRMAPILIEQPYQITYLHSYGQDSPCFAGLANSTCWRRRTRCPATPTPRRAAHDMYTGAETDWIDSPTGRRSVHAFTVCYFGSEEFLPETPYVLALIEFEGVNTLFLDAAAGPRPAGGQRWTGSGCR